MHILKVLPSLTLCILLFSCSRGGPLTPLDSFNEIRSAAERSDSEAILKNLSAASLAKIDSLDLMIKQMRDDQKITLANLYNCTPGRLNSMKRADYVSLYFSVKHSGTDLGAVFRDQVVTVDVEGRRALVRTAGGIELGFVREGPYWKLDISDL
ncbi:MAG TPA: hypothetical protein PK986_01085 [Spirochaetota bacterium]|nr:hypothetical protein [Spirochaetota bacterium]HQO39037.1 hypothetical protein [Spirochaetota bacterium]